MTEKKRKQKVLIIVHGAIQPEFKAKPIQRAERFLLGELTSPKGIVMGDYDFLAKALESDYDTVEILKWDGKLFKVRDIEPAIKSLVVLLVKYQDKEVDLIAVSLGGFIVQEALLRNPSLKVNKLLYLGAVHKGNPNLKNVRQAFNIFSIVDKMFFLANNLYEGIGNAFLRGQNVVNIPLPNVNHDELCKNKTLGTGYLKNKSLFELYKGILNGTPIFLK